MRGQDVHRLRARDARHQLHRQRLDAGGGIGIDPRALPERVERRDEPRAGLGTGKAGRILTLNGKKYVCAFNRSGTVRDRRTCISIGLVRNGGGHACAGFDRHACAESDEFLRSFRCQRDPAFAGSLLPQCCDLHGHDFPSETAVAMAATSSVPLSYPAKTARSALSFRRRTSADRCVISWPRYLERPFVPRGVLPS